MFWSSNCGATVAKCVHGSWRVDVLGETGFRCPSPKIAKEHIAGGPLIEFRDKGPKCKECGETYRCAFVRPRVPCISCVRSHTDTHSHSHVCPGSPGVFLPVRKSRIWLWETSETRDHQRGLPSARKCRRSSFRRGTGTRDLLPRA